MLRIFVAVARCGRVTGQAMIRIRSQESQIGICGGQTGNGIVFLRIFTSLTERNSDTTKKFPFGVNTTIDLKNTKTKCDNSGI